MILSKVMEKPPLQIHEIVGELKSFAVIKPSMKLRKENKIRTIHHSLAIEGNSLTEEQITAILEGRFLEYFLKKPFSEKSI